VDDDGLELEELLGRLRGGDQDALGELFARYRPQLWQMVNFRLDQRLYGRVDPSDVLQEAYIDALKRVNHFFKGTSQSFFVWLRQITEQSMIDVHRRHLGSQMRDARREVALPGNGNPPVTSICLLAHLMGYFSSPSQKAVQAEVEATVEQALESMDPIDREVLALRHFEELSNSQVAEVLQLKPSAASNRYFRALKRLKAILSGIPGFSAENPL
jgi:RNA polymerase sigma-70 factor (ECF subfamily)